jgi:hypothetical protein
MSAVKCHDIRKMLALDRAIADADVQAQVDACVGCALPKGVSLLSLQESSRYDAASPRDRRLARGV